MPYWDYTVLDDRMINECGAVHGMRKGRGNRSTQRKPPLLPLCPPQFSQDLLWHQTLAVAVGNSQLTVCALSQSVCHKSVAVIMGQWSELRKCMFHITWHQSCIQYYQPLYLSGFLTHKGMVRSDMSKPALIFFSRQEYTQQNTLSKF
jgi:hypothetical protein